MKHTPKVAIIRGKFLNAYEMQFFEPLAGSYDITAFGSKTSFHNRFRFPTVQLWSPMDLPDFPYKMPVLNRLFTDAHYLAGLEKRLKDFDLVHTAETYYRYTQQALDAKRNGYVKKVIATVLENIPYNNEGIWGRKGFKKRARQELDHIIALTEKTKNALITEGADPGKITVISHFIDTQRFHPDVRRQEEMADKTLKTVHILFVGRLEYEKGIMDVIHAVYALRTDTSCREKRYVVHIVGDGTLHTAVRKAIHAFGLDDIFVFDSVSYADMPSVYRKAHVFIAPSKSSRTWEEQYNTSLLEAQASGLPIITTKSGGIPENVGDCAVLAESGNIKEITDALCMLIVDASKRKSYASAARKRAVEVHDIQIGTRKIMSVYERVLHGV